MDKTKRKVVNAVGYCALCRALEMERYGTLIGKAGAKHVHVYRELKLRLPLHLTSSRFQFDAGA
jgi:hypothetical protein